jgi:hypothetical protein
VRIEQLNNANLFHIKVRVVTVSRHCTLFNHATAILIPNVPVTC